MTAFWSLSDKVIKHFRDPRNVGIIKNADGIGYVGDPSWGIDLELYIKVASDIIVDARFKAFGCSASIATCSMVTEMMKGRNVEGALNISAREIAEALDGLPPPKEHCAVLGQELIKSSIEDYLAKKKLKEGKQQ